MLATLRQTKALAVLTLRYWARAQVPNRLRKDQGRRASGAILRAAFFLLMTNWGYRIGIGCVHVDPEYRGSAAGWMLVGLGMLAVAWGAIGRGPALRQPQSVLTSPVLEALPLSESSRVAIALAERIVLYALATAAVIAVVPRPSPGAVALGLLLPTAGLLVGDASLRILRTVFSPMAVARFGVFALVLQFPAFMVVGGAPMLGKAPRISAVLGRLQPLGASLVAEGRVRELLLVAIAIVLVAALVMRIAETIGYDRVDVVPVRRYVSAKGRELGLARVERVLAAREPGGRWLVRGALFYTSATCFGLLALAHLSSSFPQESAAPFVRSLAYVSIFSGFAVIQARATRLVLRDATARPLLAPLPIAPADLLRGKTVSLLVQALIVSAPYFVLVAMPGPLSLRIEVVWRGAFVAAALVLAASATVSVAFLTQGLGGTRITGVSLGLETTLVAMPLLGVAAAVWPWSALVSVLALGALAYEARRSALRCVRWLDDVDQEGETLVWRALLVFATFQALSTILRRLFSLSAVEESVQVAVSYVLSCVALVGLTLYDQRGRPKLPMRPASRTALWMLAAVAVGAPLGLLMRFLEPAPAVDTMTRRVIVALVLLVVPIAEELFFRGWLQTAIFAELPTKGKWLAPVLGAFAFAALRPPVAFLPTFLLGVACGFLFARSRGLLPGVLAHTAFSAVVLL